MSLRPSLSCLALLVSFGGTLLASDEVPIATWAAPPYWTPPAAAAGGALPSSESDAIKTSFNTLALPSAPLPFVAIAPCRLADTRAGRGFSGEYGPPSMPGSATQRSFTITGQCGIPADAVAVSFNFTVWAPVTRGDIRVFPAGGGTPTVSTLNWEANILALANAAVVPLGTGGAITVQVDGAGTIDLIFDVNGYYSPLGVVNTVNGLSGALTLESGSNVTITPSGQTLTIAAAGGGDITAVSAGSGLTGGGSSGAVTLSANFAGSGVGTTVSRSDHDHFAAIWSGTASYGLTVSNLLDSGTGIQGGAYGFTGDGSGVYGTSAGTAGRGVYGQATAGTGVTYGVLGVSASTAGRGVSGLASAGTGVTYGVWGASNSSSGVGVYGENNSGTTSGTGVYGNTNSSTGGIGIHGFAPAISNGVNVGVQGESFSTEGIGVYGYGATGGEFISSGASSGHASVATGDRGIWAKGTFAGGTFSHPDNVTFWADVATPTYKIHGTGTVSFVQNHPHERDRVVVYAAPEGDEVAVYTRGSARLVDGVARVKLGPTFAWVANPDLGLTAHLTPRGQAASLWVESVGTEELVVRGPVGSNAAFDYLVYGLRIGFEELPVVQPKRQEAFLPDPAAVATEFGDHTDLKAFTALARFREMRAELGDSGPVELSRARSLAAAIDTGRPEALATANEEVVRRRADVDKWRPRRVEDGKQHASTLDWGRGPAPSGVASPSPGQASPTVRLADLPARDALFAANPEERAAPPALPSPALSAKVVLPVSEAVEAGDLLTVDAAHQGELRRASVASDPGIAAIAAGASGMTGDRLQAPVADGRYARVKADASLGPIRPGDLLTASPTPGHAMRAPEGKDAAVLIGKALEGLDSGTGQVRILVLLR